VLQGGGASNIVKADCCPLLLIWLLFVSGEVISDSTSNVSPTQDWSAESVEARKSAIPIVILFSKADCSYCERLKKEVLEPLANRKQAGFARIRELDINRGGKITDFDGEKIRTRIFVKRYGIYATPTLILVDYQGNSLGTPIVGYDNREDYIDDVEYFLNVSYWEPKKTSFRAKKN
jgi:thioredoxin-related protein